MSDVLPSKEQGSFPIAVMHRGFRFEVKDQRAAMELLLTLVRDDAISVARAMECLRFESETEADPIVTCPACSHGFRLSAQGTPAKDRFKAADEPKPCGHLRSEVLAEKQKGGEPLFQMHRCLDCRVIFRVKSSLKAEAPRETKAPLSDVEMISRLAKECGFRVTAVDLADGESQTKTGADHG
jgi:hypothetical protein